MKSNNKKTLVFSGIVLILLIIFSSNTFSRLNTKPNELKTVNYTAVDRPYSTFQVKFPSKYFVTSDSMNTSYLSQGGWAPPVLIFSTKDQALENSNKTTLKGADFIQIQSTQGFNTFDDWYENYGGGGIVLSEQTVDYGNYKFIKRIVNSGSQALINFPDSTSYYFTTSSEKLDKDLDIILQNFRVRGVEYKF